MNGLNVDMPVAPVATYGGRCGDDDFFKYLIFLGLMNGGGGLFGGNREASTVEAIATEGNWSATMSKLDSIGAGLSSLGYANLEGQNGIQMTMANGFANLGFQNSQGFNGVNNAICTASWNISRELMGMASQMASCCCETNRNIDSVRFDMSKGFCDVVTAGNLNTRDIIASQNAGTQRIVDLINDNTTQALRDRICALENEKNNILLTSSQTAQTCALEKYTDKAIANSTELILKHMALMLDKKS